MIWIGGLSVAFCDKVASFKLNKLISGTLQQQNRFSEHNIIAAPLIELQSLSSYAGRASLYS